MAHRQLTGKDPDYEFIMALGHGGFGSVAKVRRIRDGKVMACKVIDCRPDPNIFLFATREIKTWASFALSEKYIANFSQDVAWTERTKKVRLYMDFYEGGDLQRVIDQCRHEDTLVHPLMATYWAMEVARGVKACHDHGIIHRDLKPANETRPAWCHITDFGLGKFSNAAHLSGRNTLVSFIGTMGTAGFIAPETVAGSLSQNFSMKSDVYSLGCLLYALCSSEVPPPAGTTPMRIPEEYPKRLRNIITRCTDVDPNKRPNSREVANEISKAYVDILDDQKFGQMKSKLQSACSIPSPAPQPLGHSPLPPAPNQTWSRTRECCPQPIYRPIDGKGMSSESQKLYDERRRGSLKGVLGLNNPYSLDTQDELDDKLRYALFGNRPVAMDALIKAGANPRIKVFGSSVLSYTTKPYNSGDPDLTKAQYQTLRSYENCDWSNFENSELILFAVYANLDHCCVVLLSYGVMEYDHPNVVEDTTDPLLLSAVNGNVGIMEKLLEFGASLTTVQGAHGFNALHLTVLNWLSAKFTSKGEHMECARILLMVAPELINTPLKVGTTPIMMAVYRTVSLETSTLNLGMIKYLISMGANPYQKDKKGVNAFEMVKETLDIPRRLLVEKDGKIYNALKKSNFKS
ncbi:hypothetical protein H072_952 [Dactylellina haptotyla CBS 200.50]|uniref:non-specific serine/threonine protein kinase n=1 Tax=Dactylellina haptotyla (strain CBS 200.50) TaxID=1284197 RepID=S8AQ42_DACHA|nr:hypothetical protein H072_952 [Dactylellina haptotyla CBS 200.50]